MSEARDLQVTSADCLACGACCVVGGEVVVGEDDTQVPRHLTRSVRGVMGFGSWEADEIRRMARTKNHVCTALRGDVGKACRCSIYARRPSVCREFVAGSEACLAARQAHAHQKAA